MTSYNNSTAKITQFCNLNQVGKEGCYQLFITHQHSLQHEQFAENGQQKSVHYVIKNSAFVLEVGLIKSEKKSTNCSAFASNSMLASRAVEQFDFNKITLEASLCYDCPEEKEVACVKVIPINYRGSVSPTNPMSYKLEVIIKVLSSQHEEMNFKLKLVAVDTKTKLPIPEIPPVYSQPIQVISKPEVLRKKNQPKAPRGKKKTKSELILETLARIEAEQKLQSNKLNAVIPDQKLSGKKRTAPDTENFPNGSVENCPSFETAYFQFVAACQRLSKDELPHKIQKVTQNSSDSELAAFQKVASLFNHEVRVPTSMPHMPSPTPLNINGDFLTTDSQFDDLMAVLGIAPK